MSYSMLDHHSFSNIQIHMMTYIVNMEFGNTNVTLNAVTLWISENQHLKVNVLNLSEFIVIPNLFCEIYTIY